jgi:hypothetical protein
VNVRIYFDFYKIFIFQDIYLRSEQIKAEFKNRFEAGKKMRAELMKRKAEQMKLDFLPKKRKKSE